MESITNWEPAHGKQTKLMQRTTVHDHIAPVILFTRDVKVGIWSESMNTWLQTIVNVTAKRGNSGNVYSVHCGGTRWNQRVDKMFNTFAFVMRDKKQNMQSIPWGGSLKEIGNKWHILKRGLAVRRAVSGKHCRRSVIYDSVILRDKSLHLFRKAWPYSSLTRKYV